MQTHPATLSRGALGTAGNSGQDAFVILIGRHLAKSWSGMFLVEGNTIWMVEMVGSLVESIGEVRCGEDGMLQELERLKGIMMKTVV